MTMSESAIPTRPGRYRLQLPDGRAPVVKVIDMSGDLYAVHWLGLAATPVDLVDGEWLGRDEAAGT